MYIYVFSKNLKNLNNFIYLNVGLPKYIFFTSESTRMCYIGPNESEFELQIIQRMLKAFLLNKNIVQIPPIFVTIGHNKIVIIFYIH